MRERPSQFDISTPVHEGRPAEHHSPTSATLANPDYWTADQYQRDPSLQTGMQRMQQEPGWQWPSPPAHLCGDWQVHTVRQPERQKRVLVVGDSALSFRESKGSITCQKELNQRLGGAAQSTIIKLPNQGVDEISDCLRQQEATTRPHDCRLHGL